MFNSEPRGIPFVRSLITIVLICASAAIAGAQGVQTGTIRGIVHD